MFFRMFVVIVSLMCAASAKAMTFTLEQGRGGIYIVARGDIVPGDAQNFALAVPHATVDTRGFRHILLGSNGGSVQEAKAMAKVIRENNFFVVVDQDCASACAAILYPAGSHFMLMDSGRLGFHQCYDGRNFEVLPDCTKEIAELAAEHGFPYGTLKVLSEMSGPAEMTWVTNVPTPCFGMEWLPDDPPPVSLALPCPTPASF
jgi:membrane-bound ClpP family serine protease